MRKTFVVLSMLLCSIASAGAQVSVGIALPGVSIGINVPVYPDLERISGYPVYYAPRLNSNYFFYDGMYWVYDRDNWYASSWYNGPWVLVDSEAVPLFILRIPVRYYREPPAYFRGWDSDAPPRWGDHWGNAWEQRRQGWDNWNRSAVPAPAPLPVYQRQYSGNRYPRAEQQQVLEREHYRYQPHDTAVQQQFQTQRVQSAPAASPPVRQAAQPQERFQQQGQRAQRIVSSPPLSRQQAAPTAPRAQPPQSYGVNIRRPVAANRPPQQARPTAQPQARQPQARQPQARQPQARQPQARQPQARQPRAQQPQQSATQRQQPAPKAKGPDKGPQGKGHAKEPTQGQQ